MRQEDIVAIAIESGLDPDLWGHERAFVLFVELIEAHFEKKHADVCLMLAEKFKTEAMITNSGYKRTVLMNKNWALNTARNFILQKKTPPKRGQEESGNCS